MRQQNMATSNQDAKISTAPRYAQAALEGLNRALTNDGAPDTCEDISYFLYRIGEGYALGLEIPVAIQVWVSRELNHPAAITCAVEDLEEMSRTVHVNAEPEDLDPLCNYCEGLRAVMDRFGASNEQYRRLRRTQDRLETLYLRSFFGWDTSRT